MAASGRYRLPSRPVLDNWSTREKLALASSVMRIGDQNWVSVSRTIRPYAESERAENWFSQKTCALQYSDLLEKVETPKRKRGEKEKESLGGHVEIPGNVIVSRLTVDRIEELQTLVRDAQNQYMKLKQEVEAIKAGQCDDKLEEMWAEMQPSLKPAAEEPSSPVSTSTAAQSDSTQNTDTHDVTILPDDCVSPLPVLPPDVLEAALELQSPSLSDLLQKSPPDATALATIDVTAVLGDSIKEEPVDVEEVDSMDPLPDVKIEVGSEATTTPTVVDAAAPASTNKPPENASVAMETIQPASLSVLPSSAVPDIKIKEEPVDEIKEEDVPQTPTTKDRKKEEKMEEDDKESIADGFPDTPAAAMEIEDAPPSSPSSIISGDTDGGSSSRGKGHRGGHRRGSKGRSRGRSSQRTSRSSRKTTEDDKDLDMSSKAESSDDEESKNENEESDTASTAHVRSLMSESMPNSPASTLGPIFTSEEEEKAHKVWKKSIMLVWRAAANHKYANVFLHPVTEDIAPGYHSVVQRPMNLIMIKKNIESGQIRITAEFQRDMMLMFTNAIMYNNSDHDVFIMATEMYDDVMNHIEQYVLTQQMITKDIPKAARHRRSDVTEVPPPESGGKLLRGRRSEAATPGGSSDKSDKEDDRKRRISMETLEHSHGGKVKKRKA